MFSLTLFMIRSLHPESSITGLIQHRSALTSSICWPHLCRQGLARSRVIRPIFMALDVNIRKTIHLNLIIHVFTFFSTVSIYDLYIIICFFWDLKSGNLTTRSRCLHNYIFTMVIARCLYIFIRSSNMCFFRYFLPT